MDTKKGGLFRTDEDAHERRVEAVLDGQEGEFGVGERLGHDDGADGDASHEVAEGPDAVVITDPLQEGEQVVEIEANSAPGRPVLAQPVIDRWFGLEVEVVALVV